MTRLGERAIREQQLSVVETPLFALGKARARLATAAKAPMTGWLRSELASADAELKEAQRAVAAWAGYSYARGRGER